MAQNRLHLNFQLVTQEERTAFVTDYLKTLKFTPTETELDTIAKYILWGKDQNGQNVRQTGEIELETAHKTWDSKELESLDGLYESENFTEASVRPLNSVRPLIRKQVFSRENVPQTPEFLTLWDQIDETEYMTQAYELAHGKREKPIRRELLDRLEPDLRALLDARAQALSEKDYLKLRHHLVELRTEQYTLRDSYTIVHKIHSPAPYTPSELSYFGPDIAVLPVGLLNINRPLKLGNWTLASASPMGPPPSKPSDKLYFDFADVEHLYSFTQLYDDIYDFYNADPEATFNLFIETFEYFRAAADLTPIQNDVLQMKMKRDSNAHIMNVINSTYGTTYNSNYISTIYKQKALTKIAEAAQHYADVIANLDKPQNFKVCTQCGRPLLICEENFMRKAKSRDGFESRCKKCSKLARTKKEK